MNLKYLTGMAAVAALAFAGAAQADTTVYNGTPNDGWFFGTGNDYAPANTAVLTTDEGDQLYLRAHETFQTAPASTGGTYSFATGLPFISFDWGFDTSTLAGVTAQITLVKMGVTSFTYDALALGNDNETANGSTQNSFRLNWAPIGFDPNADGSYKVKLAVGGLSGGDKTLAIRVDVGNGAAGVPEPAGWALMIVGFGGAGAVLRRRRTVAAA